jgi:serine/threonine protein kinase
MSSGPRFQPFEIVESYRVIKTIASSGFGIVHFVREVGSDRPAAMKVCKSQSQWAQLESEYSVMKQVQGSLYFPRVYTCGTIGSCRYIAMELLGPSLHRIRAHLPNGRFSLSCSLRVAMEMVCILREFHSRGFVHRDVKPSNFLTRPNSPTPLCLIDFGLSKRFINSVTGEYVEAESSCFVGTCRYASVNSHRRLELGPRDDMVSWLFSIVELIRGELPWHSIAERDSVLGVKQAMSAEELCRDVPHELVSIYESLLALQCRDMPDYDMILMQLTQALRSAGGAAKRSTTGSSSTNRQCSQFQCGQCRGDQPNRETQTSSERPPCSARPPQISTRRSAGTKGNVRAGTDAVYPECCGENQNKHAIREF